MAERPARVVLVGFMGAGKTTVGRRLARRLGYAFRDMDGQIEARAGRKVARIFEESGEAAFRALELEEARAASALEGVVVAAGGGAFAQPGTRALLHEGSDGRERVDADLDGVRALAEVHLDGPKHPRAPRRHGASAVSIRSASACAIACGVRPSVSITTAADSYASRRPSQAPSRARRASGPARR